jgi:hypothetical protein
MTMSESKPIYCPYCASAISVQGGANMWISFGLGSSGGYILGKAMGDISVPTVALIISVAVAIFVVSSYFTAPIRDA